MDSNSSTTSSIEYELMQRIASGDTDAFETFNKKYHNLIFTTVFKVLNHYEDSRDVTNEVLTTLWKKADSFHPGRGSLVTFICCTARNRAIDRIRSVKRRLSLHDRYESSLDSSPELRDSVSSDTLHLSDVRNLLQSAVVELTPEQREVIELAYFDGLTHKQIAEKTDSPLGTVKARMRRGINKLRTSITAQFPEESAQLLLSNKR